MIKGSRTELQPLVKFLTIKDVAALMGMSPATFKKYYLGNGFPEPTWKGKAKLWRREVVINYIKKMGL